VCADLAQPRNALGKRLRASDRAVLIWSGPGGGGGARIAELAHTLGLEGKPDCGAFYLPATPNGHGVALAWSAASEAEEANPQPLRLLVVSGDEAAADPSVRALAEDAERVIAITMFHELAAGWADLILPATAALERDGTSMNLEGRVQRLRRAVPPPCPDELAWISRLGQELGVDIPAYASEVFAELAGHAFRDLSLAELSPRAPLAARRPYETPAPATTPAPGPLPAAGEGFVGELRLLRYRPVFAGPAVERVRELEFLRPEAEVEISLVDADRRGIATGDAVRVRSNGTSVELRARVNRKLVEGVARIADEHAGDLHPMVEVAKA
jgi:NADH-quinone oxidoreductase subunit G